MSLAIKISYHKNHSNKSQFPIFYVTKYHIIDILSQKHNFPYKYITKTHFSGAKADIAQTRPQTRPVSPCHQSPYESTPQHQIHDVFADPLIPTLAQPPRRP